MNKNLSKKIVDFLENVNHYDFVDILEIGETKADMQEQVNILLQSKINRKNILNILLEYKNYNLSNDLTIMLNEILKEF